MVARRGPHIRRRPAQSLSDPHYFGPGERNFGLLNWPLGTVRGAAVICPPLGYEGVTSHQTLRVLAERLAESGIATLRLDYAGTGNSLDPSDDSSPLEAYQDTIRAGLAELESLGLDRVVVVGLRFGAALAATATSDSPSVSGFVFWDPIGSGRKYGRMLMLMSSMGAASEDGSIRIAGIRYSPQIIAEIKKLKILPGSVRQPNLVVLRPSEETDDWPLSIAREADTLTVRREGTDGMLDIDAELSVVPYEIVDEVSSWVVGRAAAAAGPRAEPRALSTATSDQRDEGRLTHRAVRIGGAKMFAIDTAVESTNPQAAVIMLNNGVSPAIGPGRAWVQWSATIAQVGLRVLRLDLDGLGESPAREGNPAQLSYPPGAVADIADAVAYLHAQGVHRVSVLGLCSGAILGYAAVSEGIAIDHVISINPRFDSPRAYRWSERHHGRAKSVRSLIDLPLTKSPLFPAFDRVPTWVWTVLRTLRIIGSAAALPDAAVRRSVPSMIILGDREWGLAALRRRTPRALQTLYRSDHVQIHILPDLDHSMFNPRARDEVYSRVRAELVRFGAGELVVRGPSTPSGN